MLKAADRVRSGSSTTAPPKAAEPNDSAAAMRTITGLLVTIVFTQKLAVPGSNGALQLAPFIFYAVMGYLLIRGRVQIAGGRVVLFLLSIAIGALMHAIYHGNKFSVASFGLLTMIYASCMFVLPITHEQYTRLLYVVQNIGVFGALFVGIDWAVQIAGLPIPNIEKLLPTSMWVQDFAYLRTMKFGSRFIKPNGLVFLEPSHLSQFLAFCVFIELVYFKRIRYMALFFVAMFFTYGGTGMLLVALTAPFALGYVPPGIAMGVGVLGAVALAGAGALGLLDDVIGRTSEFSGKNTSAYFRFVAPLELISDVLNGAPLNALVGAGAGNSPKGVNVTWIPLAKVIFEYGLFFAVVWFPLTLASVFGRGRSLIVGWMMFVQYHILNGSLLIPINFLYCMLFSGLYILPAETGEPPAKVKPRVPTKPPGRPAAAIVEKPRSTDIRRW